ncbi:thiaminase II [Pseudoruegeria sp. SK021]|uniref:thiaminase II n=1 Tax=Pseudoruegeria sp. SK021 TaxID=1933035 RepID=UPI000A248A3F|nr:thiaminase II [Pseudoruegeria sp. SK021]OSP56468.1 thiaminase II [Pseudoruegeria sp. SK021]
MTHPDYGRAFGLFRDAAGPAWTDYTRHAFVQKLGDGTLPRAAFLHYLVQDYVFLTHFTRGWALAIVKSETLEETRLSASLVQGLVHGEMQLHVKICADEGISEQTLFEAAESPANLAYTRYVMDAGQAGDLCDLLAALAPCVFGYGEIGLQLAQTRAADTPYGDWIDTYAGDDYQALCRDVGVMLDGALTRRIGSPLDLAPRWPRLCKRFSTATALEVGFWQMGLDQT